MRGLKVFCIAIIVLIGQSCSNDDHLEPEPITLEMVLNGYDLWYVDYHSAVGSGDVPFVANAFTLSFLNGKMYANNNLVGIGGTGEGLGIPIGFYSTIGTMLEVDHDLDGFNDFQVEQVGDNVITLYNSVENVTYYLEGYHTNTFNYDQIFYENIEYFLQEYVGWEKTYTSETGVPNAFDYENYLAFTPEDITTFYSSEDDLGTNIDLVNWDFVGGYEVFDVEDEEALKILTLDYDNGDNEEFELTVINDEEIELYHVDSGSTYEFIGREFLQYLKNGSNKSDIESVRNMTRKRTKVQRLMKVRKEYLK